MTENERFAEEELFFDALFRQKRKKGKYRLVDAPCLEGPVADTHAHLQLLPDPAMALARCAVHGVSFVCTIVDIYEDGATAFDCLAEWRREAEWIVSLWDRRGFKAECGPEDGNGFDAADAAAHAVPAREGMQAAWAIPPVRIATGCHPHNAQYYDDALEAKLRARLADPRVCAVGEIGLDYHYDFSPREDQLRVFRAQVRLAKECGLPVILHVREAHDDAFALLQEEGFPPAGVLLHCFNRDGETLAPWVEAGCFVAFGGPLTFKGADDVREAALQVPLNRLLTETDAPYMTPEPMRGMICGPEHVIFTAERLAQVRESEPGSAREAFLQQLMVNARGLLDRDPTPWQQTAMRGISR